MDKLQNHLDILDDLRIDTSSDTVDINTQGLRALNFIIKDLMGRHFWRFTEKETTINYYVKNIIDGFEASGTFSFDGTPPMLTLNNWRNNNTSSVAVGFGINRIITRTSDV